MKTLSTTSKKTIVAIALLVGASPSVVRAQSAPEAVIAKRQAELDKQRIELEKKSVELQQEQLDLEKAQQEFQA